jgi:PleD family two-component response regulator
VKKIVVIVDDWERLERIEDRLRVRFEVFGAPFGAMGIQIAVEESPDFILIDLEFEDMNEEEALALIHAEKSLQKTPVFVISNSETLSVQPRIAAKILKRPVSIDAIVDLLLLI